MKKTPLNKKLYIKYDLLTVKILKMFQQSKFTYKR